MSLKSVFIIKEGPFANRAGGQTVSPGQTSQSTQALPVQSAPTQQTNDFQAPTQLVQRAIQSLKGKDLQTASSDVGRAFKWIQDFNKKNTQEVPEATVHESDDWTSGGTMSGMPKFNRKADIAAGTNMRNNPVARFTGLDFHTQDAPAIEKIIAAADSALKNIWNKMKGGSKPVAAPQEDFYAELIKLCQAAEQGFTQNQTKSAGTALSKAFQWINAFKKNNTQEVPATENYKRAVGRITRK